MKKLCIVIPIYKKEFTKEEEISLEYLRRNSVGFDLYYAIPKHMERECLPNNWEKISFANRFFESVNAYTRLLLSEEFYGRFTDYSYMLLCQIDALLLKCPDEEFEEFYEYDYVGAPWIPSAEVYSYSFRGISVLKKMFHPRICVVGNGGFSLRNIASCKELLHQKKKYTRCWNAAEDSFFAYHGQDSDVSFKIAPMEVAGQFALEVNAKEEMEKGKCPYGIHAWKKFYPEIMEKDYGI